MLPYNNKTVTLLLNLTACVKIPPASASTPAPVAQLALLMTGFVITSSLLRDEVGVILKNGIPNNLIPVQISVSFKKDVGIEKILIFA